MAPVVVPLVAPAPSIPKAVKERRLAVLVALAGFESKSWVEVAPLVRTVMVVCPRDAVEDACKTPASWREPAIVDDPLPMRPPVRDARDATERVEEAERPPRTVRLEPTDEDAVETKPARVESPATLKVLATVADADALSPPRTVRLAPTDEEAVETNPANVESPATLKVLATVADEDALSPPDTVRFPAIDEEAPAVNPPADVTT